MGQAKQFDPEEKLDLAVEAFWKNGFEGSAVQDVCKAMGLFTGSLYGTFGDKRQTAGAHRRSRLGGARC
jgi:TetR/AcrR family transcriptional repressor of nem operon